MFTIAKMSYRAQVANAYRMAVSNDTPHTRRAWQDLANETAEHYERIAACVSILRTSNPEPYSSAYDMVRDIQSGHIKVSTANCEHPLWDTETNVQFRVVHDVIGHAITGAGFSWDGELRAYESHLGKTESIHAKHALFTEAVGQVAYAIEYGGFGVQKCVRLPQWLQWAYSANEVRA